MGRADQLGRVDLLAYFFTIRTLPRMEPKYSFINMGQFGCTFDLDCNNQVIPFNNFSVRNVCCVMILLCWVLTMLLLFLFEAQLNLNSFQIWKAIYTRKSFAAKRGI